jgi:1,4-alpha-glucan branching enzyme
MAGVQLDVQAARSVADPVLASPGNFGASVGISWRILSGSREFSRPIAQVGRSRPEGQQVVFTLEADSASSVSLSGSFSEWQPIPMRRIGKTFLIEVTVPSGVHHYGFLINGTEWHVPLAAGGIVDDGFGRKNATIVIE